MQLTRYARRSFFLFPLCALCLLAQSGVYTANYDNFRTNSNLQETRLTPSNVGTETFGRLFSLPVDGQVYAQPLYVPGVSMPDGGVHNVVYVATMHNSVYAFDAEAGGSRDPLWKVNLGPAVPTANYSAGYYFTDVNPEVGILSTPVIDPGTNTLYAVAATFADGQYAYTLHALDIATGMERPGSPVAIQASVPGVGDDNDNGTVRFNAFWHLQRPGLLLSDGVVYVAFGSRGDAGIYHGWLVGYAAADVSRQVAVYNASPDGTAASFWMSGRGLAAGEDGTLYGVTANGTYDGVRNFGESALRLDPKQNLAVLDWFTPDNYGELNDVDNDFGSCGPMLVPGTGLLVTGGKDGVLYLLARDNLGRLSVGNRQAVQGFQAVRAGIFTMAVWSRPDGTLMYVQGARDPVVSYWLRDGVIDTAPASQGTVKGGIPFYGMALSANGGDASSGILWTTSSSGGPGGANWRGTLHAYDASDLSHELWNSDLSADDGLPSFAKFAAPTVADGRVYVPTFSNQVVVYGLKSDGQNAARDIEVVNAFSRQGGAVSPGELVVLRGTGIGPADRVQYQPDGSGLLPDNLGGIQVQFDGRPAAAVEAGANWIVTVVPYSVAGQATTTITASGCGAPVSPLTVAVADASPGLASVNGAGVGAGIFMNEDGTANAAGNAAPRGTVVSIAITGAGATSPPNDWIDELATLDEYPEPALPVTARVNGDPAEVVYAGSGPGMLGAVIVVQIRIPETAPAGDGIPVAVRVGGATAPAVTISVQ